MKGVGRGGKEHTPFTQGSGREESAGLANGSHGRHDDAPSALARGPAGNAFGQTWDAWDTNLAEPEPPFSAAYSSFGEAGKGSELHSDALHRALHSDAGSETRRGRLSKRASISRREALRAGTTPPPASDRASTFAGHSSGASRTRASRAVSIGKASPAAKTASRMGRIKSAATPPPTLPYRPMFAAADVVYVSI